MHNWQQLWIDKVQKKHLSSLEALLNLCDVLSIRYAPSDEEALYEPEPGTTPLWNHLNICATFDKNTQLDALLSALNDHPVFAELLMRIEPLENTDWQDNWQKASVPLAFGPALWVVPSCHSPPDPNATNIHLDPGLAFGTGQHPTTAMCLTWLATNPIEQKSLIDYGCGSGILGIAACKRGARPIYLVDIDPQALMAAENNAKKNQVDAFMSFHQAETFPKQPCDLIIANILLNPLLTLRHLFEHCLKENGKLLLSGLLATQQDQFLQHYQPHWRTHKINNQDGWLFIELSKS